MLGNRFHAYNWSRQGQCYFFTFLNIALWCVTKSVNKLCEAVNTAFIISSLLHVSVPSYPLHVYNLHVKELDTVGGLCISYGMLTYAGSKRVTVH
jgi:hypothetical protein